MKTTTAGVIDMNPHDHGFPDLDPSMQCLPLEQSTPWTTFVNVLIHQATCELCAANGPPEVMLRVLIDGVPHMAVIRLELRSLT